MFDVDATADCSVRQRGHAGFARVARKLAGRPLVVYPAAIAMIFPSIPVLTAAEAAETIHHGALVGFSGFTPAGAAKAVPRALAEKARREQASGREFRLRVLAGASTGDAIDEELARADAIAWRAPFQSSRSLRRSINEERTEFADMHLSHVGQMLGFGFLGELDVAVIEATDVTADGRITLSSSVGISPTLLRYAKRIFVELNQHHSPRLREMQDVLVLPKPPHRSPIAIGHPLSKVGSPFVAVDPKRIAGIIETDAPDGVLPAQPPDDTSKRIAEHIVRFLHQEREAGRIPPEFLPLQAGVGNVANAVIGGLGEHQDIPPFFMFTEVLQDSQVHLIEQSKLLGVSTCSLTLSEENLRVVYQNMDFFGPRIVLRPSEISNNPGIIRRLGVIAINTVLEFDIYGCANSTHVCGTQLMNGIGGSGDFVRNAYLSILVAPSTAKGGAISSVVPMCTHVDHTEHSVQIVVTEHGLADLRGLGPLARAHRIIECCAAPAYRDYLSAYLRDAPRGHIRHDLSKAFELHQNYQRTGRMLPG